MKETKNIKIVTIQGVKMSKGYINYKHPKLSKVFLDYTSFGFRELVSICTEKRCMIYDIL